MQLSHTRPVTAARFDDPNLISTAGLVPVMVLAQAGCLLSLADQHLCVPTDKGSHAGRKIGALVVGMVGGADSIADLAILSHGAMGTVFDRPYAPSTLGSFLRQFAFGHAVASRVLCALAQRSSVVAGIDTGRVLVISTIRSSRSTATASKARPRRHHRPRHHRHHRPGLAVRRPAQPRPARRTAGFRLHPNGFIDKDLRTLTDDCADSTRTRINRADDLRPAPAGKPAISSSGSRAPTVTVSPTTDSTSRSSSPVSTTGSCAPAWPNSTPRQPLPAACDRLQTTYRSAFDTLTGAAQLAA